MIAASHVCRACSAITLGRVAWVCPGQIAPHLAHFVGPWCSALRSIRDDVEKEHAFLGLCALLRANPEVLPWRLPRCTAECILHSELCPAWISQCCMLGSGRHRWTSMKMCTGESSLGGLSLSSRPGWHVACTAWVARQAAAALTHFTVVCGLKAWMLGAGGADVMGAAVRGHGVLAHDAGRGPAQRAHPALASLQGQPGELWHSCLLQGLVTSWRV